MKNILIAVDEPEEADRLTAEAVKIAKLTNAKIWIIHVSESNPDDFLSREAGPQYVYDQRDKDRKKEAASLNQWANDIIETHGIASEGLLLEGLLVKSIKKIVEQQGIDLIVAGHKPKNLMHEVFTANIKKDLIDDLKIPLLAVPLV